MADPEPQQVRAPEPINITVIRARNLRGSKGDNIQAVVRVEFGEKTLGESPKVECSPEVPAEYNYQTNINCTFEDPLALDELACKPVVLTITEVLPKEKKQKEEKTVILGQCTFDLLPLVKGAVKHKYTLQVHPLSGSPLENASPDLPIAEVDVSISVNDPLLTEAQLEECNLMTLTLESLYAPPESWQLTGAQHMYTVSLPIPITAEKENTIVFPNGVLKPSAEKEPPTKQKKWLMPGSAQGNATLMPDSFISSDHIEDEDGDYRAKEDRDHRAVAEQEKNRLVWNSERRSHFEPAACKSLQDKIAKNRYWPVEVMRIAAPTGGKGKKDDDNGISFHGVAYVNMAPLLYPGVKRIRGAYKVAAFNENDVFEKTKRKGTLAEEAARIASGMMSRSANSPFPKKGEGKGGDKPGKEAKKGSKGDKEKGEEASAMLKPTDTGSEADQAPVNVEGQQYVENKSYIVIEICLTRPLVPKRPPEELARKVAEYIPPRPLFPKRTNGAQKSVEEYHSQIGSVASLVLDEFRDLYGEELRQGDMSQDAKAMEARRQKLIFELNQSGKYFAFKEQLKNAVVKIVREKYLKTTNFEDKDQLQAFLSELYVYLVDQMHVALGKVLSLEDQTPVPEPLTDSAQLKHFAREAEVNENFEWATKYYKERIARNRNDPEHWFDYGTFSLYINDLTKAEECFKECVAIDQKHLNGLLLYGVVCAMAEKHEAAETFFECATRVDSKSILALTMLGLFYDGIGNDIGAEMAFLEANKLNVAAAAALAKANRPAPVVEPKEEKPDTPQEEAAKDAESIGDQEEMDRSPRDDTTSESHKEGVEIKNNAATPGSSTSADKSKSPNPGSKPGSDKKPSNTKKVGGGLGARTRSNDSVNSIRPGSKEKGTRSVSVTPQPEVEEEPAVREPTPVPTQSIFMQAVEFLLEVKAMPFTERALAHELLDPMGGPTAAYHIAFARLKLQKKEFEDAEDSLNEALQLDYQNADAWSIMGHVKYMLGDTTNAKDCYERTLSFLSDATEMHSIYLRLASIYLHETKFQEAKNTFLMACKNSPSCVSWLGVGIACYRLDELSEAEDALSEANILNNYDPEVWSYLSLVCLKTSRELEAEQAYKYALKLNLQDEDLLNEIQRVQEEVGFGNPQL
ncbi:cilia- and flagella-associated protein 70-like isoform X2 [Lineus longissimus]|uniref:cilia- and flagella-associated protein 70-like isoform X2 n=1 Tax=Lineus longissimus TaxID=88925 RepID=UPI002B4EE6CF